MREFTGNGSRGKRGFRRATVARLAGHFDSESMRALAASDVYWDSVVDVVPRGVEDVYDLEVDGEHNFVADGLVVHNSHSAAYAVVAFQTAYFKRHHPAAFYAANLSAVMGDTDKVKELVEDAKGNGIVVLAPDINAGNFRFEPVDARSVRYGLGGIKGTGEGAIAAIVAARSAGGPYTSLFDLCARVDKHQVNRRVLEALVRAGALDGLHADRAVLLASVGRALEQAERAAAHAGQENLFGDPAEPSAPAIEYVAARPWSNRERLANEKAALGYYFSGHLFAEYEAEARQLAPTRLADVRQARDPVRLTGVIVSARSQNTRRGRMGVIVLDDGSAQLELMVFSELYDRKRALLKEDALVFVVGKVRFDEFNQRLSISADELMDLAEARARADARLRIELDGAIDLAVLKRALAPYQVSPRGGGGAARVAADGGGNGAPAGGCRVVVGYCSPAARVDLALPEAWRVRPDEALVAELKAQARVREAYFNYG
jgi:DNA polymerase-3 subunit alpha